MSEKIIEFDKVVAGYSPSLTILNETTLDARKGEITLLIGPNGAGKSTVLKTLFGLLTPRSGEVRFEGKNINGKSQRELLADGIAFVPQGRNLFGSLSVRHNLELGGITLPRGELPARIEEVLQRFPRIRERIDNQASTMSGGEQKQLEVGRALLLRPRVLLIDEPSIGLSPKLVQEVMTLLRELADGGVDRADGRAERAHGAQVCESRAGARDGPAGARPAGVRAAARSGPEPAVPGRACDEAARREPRSWRSLTHRGGRRGTRSAAGTWSSSTRAPSARSRRSSIRRRRRWRSRAAPACRSIASLEELFAQQRPDGVIIATPNQLHVDQRARVHRRRRRRAGREAGRAHGRRRRAAGARRPSAPMRRCWSAIIARTARSSPRRARSSQQGTLGSLVGGDGQRDVLQAGQLLRRGAVAARSPAAARSSST